MFLTIPEAIVALWGISTFVFYTQYFLPWQERRKDLVQLNDRILNRFPVFNTYIPVNLLSYASYVAYGYDLATGRSAGYYETVFS